MKRGVFLLLVVLGAGCGTDDVRRQSSPAERLNRCATWLKTHAESLPSKPSCRQLEDAGVLCDDGSVLLGDPESTVPEMREECGAPKMLTYGRLR